MTNNILPSKEYLFNKATLSAFIQSLGGPHFWIPPPQAQPIHFRGDYLTSLKNRWRALGANSFISSVRSGFQRPLYKKPSLVIPTKRIMRQYATKSSPVMTQMIQELLD